MREFFSDLFHKAKEVAVSLNEKIARKMKQVKLNYGKSREPDLHAIANKIARQIEDINNQLLAIEAERKDKVAEVDNHIEGVKEKLALFKTLDIPETPELLQKIRDDIATLINQHTALITRRAKLKTITPEEREMKLKVEKLERDYNKVINHIGE